MIFDEIELIMTNAIPTVFDDSLSYHQSISKLKGVVNELIKYVNSLTGNNNNLTQEYKKVMTKLEEFNKKLNEYENGYFIKDGSITLNKLAKDTTKMIEDLVINKVGDIAKFVSFGLNDNGYFVAYIPTSWNDITFSSTPDGNLILEY